MIYYYLFQCFFLCSGKESFVLLLFGQIMWRFSFFQVSITSIQQLGNTKQKNFSQFSSFSFEETVLFKYKFSKIKNNSKDPVTENAQQKHRERERKNAFNFYYHYYYDSQHLFVCLFVMGNHKLYLNFFLDSFAIGILNKIQKKNETTAITMLKERKFPRNFVVVVSVLVVILIESNQKKK